MKQCPECKRKTLVVLHRKGFKENTFVCLNKSCKQIVKQTRSGLKRMKYDLGERQSD